MAEVDNKGGATVPDIETKDVEASHVERTETALNDDKPVGYVADTIAADYVDPTLHISPEEDKRLTRKIWRHVIPIMCVAYITQSLDKGTLGSSSIMGWLVDVQAKGQDYASTSTLFWCGIIIGEPIVNQLIRRLPVAKILAASMLIWSILVMGLAFSLHIPEVFAIRFLLGVCEASFGPVLTTITVQWFTVNEQTLVATTWQAMLCVSGAFGSLLAFGFYHVTGHHPLRGWQWLTVCISLISFVSTGIVYAFLPDSPVHARWATDNEKTKYVERVRGNDQGLKNKVWRSEQAWEAARDPLTYMLFVMYFLMSAVAGGLGTFNGLLVNRAFGFSVTESLLVGIPNNCFQVCLYFIAALLNRRIGQTVYIMISFVMLNVAGTIVLLTVAPSHTTRGGLLVAFYCMGAFQATQPSQYAMLSRNVAGHSKKSIVYAVFFISWAAGNAIGPQLFQARWAPRYYNTLYIHLGLYVVFVIDVLAMRTLLVRRNVKRDKAQRERGHNRNLHVHAFEDQTDLQNEDFRYSY